MLGSDPYLNRSKPVHETSFQCMLVVGSESVPCRPECLQEWACDSSVGGSDECLHSGVPLRELDELRPEVLAWVPDVRDGVDRDRFRRCQSRVGRLVPCGLLLEVNRGYTCVGVLFVFLGQVLRLLEEGRQRGEYRGPAVSRESGAPACEAGYGQGAHHACTDGS